MRTPFVAGFAAVLWIVGPGLAEVWAQGTISFAKGYPVFTGQPNRSITAAVEYSPDAGYTTTKVEVRFYRVTFPGGGRTETQIGLANDTAPPLAQSGTFKAGVFPNSAGTYCVKGYLYTKDGNGVDQTPVEVISADKAID